MFYVDVRTEVRTRHYLPTRPGPWQADRRPVVPRRRAGAVPAGEHGRAGDRHVQDPGAPGRAAATCRRKQVAVEEFDLVMVPGVAFDRRGARMGHGMGYYDKLLEHARPDTPLVALAFECQLFPEIPTQEHDIFMDQIITEQAIYPGKGAGPWRRDSSAQSEYGRGRRHLRRSVSQHLRRGSDHGPRSALARPGRGHAATGNASSTILCDCEAGLDRYVGPGGDDSFRHARRPARRDRAIPRAALPQGSRRRRWSDRCWCASARTCSPAPRPPASTCSTRPVLQAGAQDRLLRRRLPVSRPAPRPQGLGDSDPGGRIRRSIAASAFATG